ncbi:YbaB/EbfC family nucleoid-associated protein [Crossiella sp. NPDC003009]
MSNPFQQEIDELLAGYQEQRAKLGEMQRALAQVRATATASGHSVEVTVGAHGDILELAFPSGAYRRMAPSELAAVLLETIDSAKAKAATEVAELLAPFTAGQEDMLAAFRTEGVAAFVPEQPPMPDAVRHYLKHGTPTGEDRRG